MTGKILVIIIVLSAAIAGIALYYTQVYGFYATVVPNGNDDVVLAPLDGSEPQVIDYTYFKAIDAESSPIRYRACFTTSAKLDSLAAQFLPSAHVVPRNAPGWFECFDSAFVAQALEEGHAQAFVSVKNIAFGVDRIVAITDDGRGYVWHELNNCGHKAYDGTVVGETCPPRTDQ